MEFRGENLTAAPLIRKHLGHAIGLKGVASLSENVTLCQEFKGSSFFRKTPHAMATKSLAAGKVHVISRSGQWAVTRQGASRASKIVESQGDAVNAAKRLASGKAQIVVHRRDGTVSKRIGISRAATR